MYNHVVLSFDISWQGLTSSQARAKLLRDGPNRLTPPPTTSEWRKLLEQMTGFFSLLLWTGSILGFVGFGLKGEMDNVGCAYLFFICFDLF